MGLKLFDGGDGSDEDMSKIEINKDFARRFEHNKKREDLQRLEELKKKGAVSDSSGSDPDDSSDDDLVGPDMDNLREDVEFLNALIKVKNQDPVLRDKEAKLFESENEEGDEENEEEEEDRGRGNSKKEKPMYLKDVAAKHLIEEGPEFEDGEDRPAAVRSHAEEQEETRRAILDEVEAAFGGDDGGDLLKERERRKGENDVDDDVQNLCDAYFGTDGNLDGNEMFLKEYFRKRMWAIDSKDEKPLDEEGLDFSADEEEIKKQEDYEIGYNFRHEENAGDRVLGHSRFVEGSVRKKTNTRKLQRERKEERIAQAEFERKEELKHLKNLKKKEMKEKLQKIRETAGIGEDGFCLLDEDDLEEEFDPDEYDRKMKEAFNDDYYDAEDADPEFGSDEDADGGELEKPDFDKEDELLGLPKGWDDVPDGFLAARERNLKRRTEREGYLEPVEEQDVSQGAKQKKRKMSRLENKVLDKDLEEYYKLDYEDTIGDLKTRFKYKDVGAKRYGLSVEEIFMMDDKELNQYVSLKKLAPYREKEWKVPRNKRYQQKQRNTLLLEGVEMDHHKYRKKNSKGDSHRLKTIAASVEDGKSQPSEPNGDISQLSKRSRKRKRQAELKLSHSRLMAYGKIPSKSKSKKN